MEPFHWLPAPPLSFTPSIWPVMNGGGGYVLGGVWCSVRYVWWHHHNHTPPPHTHTHTHHHWCDKNFTSLRNFIYSVDIRLWLKTIKKREREREIPWIAYANPTLGIYHMEAKGTGWLTACCPLGTLALPWQWHHMLKQHFFPCYS